MKTDPPLQSSASLRQNTPVQKIPAIILAAGRGRRLGDYTDVRPKCLLQVGGQALICHQLEALRSFGTQEAFVVVGFNAETVRERLGSEVHYILNERHAETNSLYSLWLAREQCREGFVLLNGDVLFDPEILKRLLHSPHPDALAVECRHRFDQEQMKVVLAGDRVTAMSKTLDPAEAHAENLGLVKFSAKGAKVLFTRMEEMLDDGAAQQFAPYAFNAIAADHPLHAVPVDGLPWTEIDFVDDLIHARETVWPAILQRQARTPAEAPAPGKALAPANPSSVPGD